MRTRIKICGITNLEDAKYAIASGADALGFVFYPPSPRYIEPQLAAEIISQLPAFVTMVGLFVDEGVATIEQTISQVAIDLLQFHGSEEESFCQQFRLPYIKAIRMQEGVELLSAMDKYRSARAILLDTYVAGVAGGTGDVFNWDLIPKQTQQAIILAGGLNPENIATAIKTVSPYAVDVSGGVEKTKGIKDHHKINAFMKNTE